MAPKKADGGENLVTKKKKSATQEEIDAEFQQVLLDLNWQGGGSQKRRLSRKASTASNVSSASQAPKPVVSVATSASQAPATKPVATEQPSKCEVVRSATPQKALPSSLPDVVSTEVVLVSSQPPVPSQETQQDWTDAQPRTPFTTPVPSPAPKKKKMDEDAIEPCDTQPLDSSQTVASQRTLMLGESGELGHEQPSIMLSTLNACRLDSMETIRTSPSKFAGEFDVELKVLVKQMLFDGGSHQSQPGIPESSIKWIETYMTFNFEPAKVAHEYSGRISDPKVLNEQACKSSEKIQQALNAMNELAAFELKRNSGVAEILGAVRNKQAMAEEHPHMTSARKIAVKQQLEDWGSNKLKMMDGFLAKRKEAAALMVDEACDEVVHLYHMVHVNDCDQGKLDHGQNIEADFMKDLESQLADLKLDLGGLDGSSSALDKPIAHQLEDTSKAAPPPPAAAMPAPAAPADAAWEQRAKCISALDRATTLEMEARVAVEHLESEQGEPISPEERRQARALYMRFYRSIRSNACPEAVAQAASKCPPKSLPLQQLFEDYVSSGEDWLKSSCVMNARRTSSQQIWGDEKFTTYKDLKTRYGSAIAKKIRDDKHAMNSSVPDGDMPFTMPHPDCPGNEELELIRVWDATLVRKAQTDETSYSMEARADLAGHQTADFMKRLPGQPGTGLQGIPGLAGQPQQTGGADDSATTGPGRPTGTRPKREPKQLTPKDVAVKSLKDGNKQLQELKALRIKLQNSETLSVMIKDGFTKELDSQEATISQAVDTLQLKLIHPDDVNPDDFNPLINNLTNAVQCFNKSCKTIKASVADPPKPRAKGKALVRKLTSK